MAEGSAPLYEVIGAIGSGGMGVVYEARDLRLDRRIALKLLHRHLTMESGSSARFEREAKLAARVEHPGVVRVYGIGELDGQVAIELQYIDGVSLSSLIASHPLSPAQAVDLMRQVLEVLAACHANDVVHCDLKPANLMVTRNGQIFLADFGISRALYSNDGNAPTSTTMSGWLWGTPSYCPPEIWDGLQPDPRWDLYALGVLVHEALAGELPFDNSTPAVLMREKLEKQHRSIAETRSDLSPQLVRLVDRLKSRSPSARPQSAEEALELLHETPELQQLPAGARPLQGISGKTQRVVRPATPSTLPAISLATAPPRSAGGRLPLWAIAAVGFVAILATTGCIAFALRPQQAETPIVASVAPQGKVGEITAFFLFQGLPYFSYDDGSRGRELWYVSPENGRCDIVEDMCPGPGSSNPRNFLTGPTADAIFTAYRPDIGEELWRLMRTEYRTHELKLIKDILPGPMSSEPLPMAQWNGRRFFRATTLQYGPEPWVTNTNEQQTGMVADLMKGDGGSLPVVVSLLRDEAGAYFMGFGGERGDPALWRYDVATNAISFISAVPLSAHNFLEYKGNIYFTGEDKEHGFELWVCEIPKGESHIFMDIFPGPESSDGGINCVFNDKLLFHAKTRDHGLELWETDGTIEGTRTLKDINAGVFDGDPHDFVRVGDRMFFKAKSNEYGLSLWVTDGTAEGTTLACDPWPGSESTAIYNVSVNAGRIFFSADDGVHGEELWVASTTDPMGTAHMIEDLMPGPTHAQPHDLRWASEATGYFACDGPKHDRCFRIDVAGEEITLTEMTGLPVTPQKNPSS